MEKILTGKRKVLSSGLVAVETYLGWTSIANIYEKNKNIIQSRLAESIIEEVPKNEITGVDMAGHLFLKESNKSWVLIFTCAVYRAVHFQLVTAASTDVVLMAFRRFISRRGRCATVYRDNGTNFVGAANHLKQLNWLDTKIWSYQLY
ncbi:uncharacterized protein TNCV_3306211 [Trichonephila clavipes]|nr:uncharacterized protein TNCV_3306211 [Trichonephila clavipes]